jgi:hypothetical protein
MSSIFTVGPVGPEAFTAWSIDDGIVIEVDETDSLPWTQSQAA